MKICNKCSTEKSEAEFYSRKGSKDGLRNECKKCHNIKSKEYYEENREKINKRHRDYFKVYYKDNKDEILKKTNLYKKHKRRTNPLSKMKFNLRNRTCQAFKKSYWHKDGKTEKILGAKYEVVFNHLESMFSDGMSWENQGEWHIDHIIPLASATTKEELVKLCHYKNLQPLWAKDNLAKGSKML